MNLFILPWHTSNTNWAKQIIKWNRIVITPNLITKIIIIITSSIKQRTHSTHTGQQQGFIRIVDSITTYQGRGQTASVRTGLRLQYYSVPRKGPNSIRQNRPHITVLLRTKAGVKQLQTEQASYDIIALYEGRCQTASGRTGFIRVFDSITLYQGRDLSCQGALTLIKLPLISWVKPVGLSRLSVDPDGLSVLSVESVGMSGLSVEPVGLSGLSVESVGQSGLSVCWAC